MADQYGPPAPPTPHKSWQELRYAVRYSIPESLNRTAKIIRQMQHRRRRG